MTAAVIPSSVGTTAAAIAAAPKVARVEWIDAARGLGIVLVVFGHVNAGLFAAGLLDGSADAPMGAVTRFVYGFHMPLFLVLAGLVAPRAVVKPAGTFWADKLGSLAYPYLVWSVLQLSVQAALTGATNNPATWRDLPRVVYDPPMQFWFLYCLFAWFAAYRLVAALGGGSVWFLGLSLAVALGLHAVDQLVIPIPGTSVLGRTRESLPFFALGAAAASSLRRGWSAPTPLLAGLTAGGFAASALLTVSGVGESWPLGLVTPLPGVAATVALCVLLTRGRMSARLGGLGRLSLEIYVAHVLAYAGTRIVLAKVLGVTWTPAHVVIGTFAGLACPLALVAVAEAVGFRYLFRWPHRTPATIGL